MMSASTEGASLGVAQLVDNLAVGGAENLAVRIANAWAARGQPAFIYVLRDSGPLADRVDPGVEVRFLGVTRRSIANPVAFAASLIKGRRRLLDQLAEDRVGALQSHLTNANFWTLLLALTSRVVGYPTIHNNQEFNYGSSGLKGLLNRRAYRLMIRKCAGVIACSDEVRASLMETLGLAVDPGNRLLSIPNAVPGPAEVSSEEARAVRQKYGIEEDVPLVLAAGRFTDQKNFALLLEAVPAVLDQIPGAMILVAGEGELRQDLETQASRLGIRERVLLPGNVDDLGALMETADLFVLSSRFEGLPLVLLESMSHGLPVVCTRIKGTGDIITHGSNGWLVDADQPTALAQGMVAVLQDADLARSLGMAARKTIQDHYSFDVLMDRLANLYLRV